MAVNGKAFAHGSATHAARVLRNAVATMFGLPVASHANAIAPTTRGGGYGVILEGDLLVTGTGGLNYSIAVGRVVATGTFATAQGDYTGYNDAAVAGALGAHSAFIRHDLICYRVRDTDEDATGSEDDLFHVVQGITGSTDPAIPSSLGSLVVLSRAVVPATSGTPTFTDLRQWATAIGGIQRVRSTERPTGAALYPFMVISERDTGIYYRWTGSAWRRQPGEVSYTALTADSLNYTTLSDITGLTSPAFTAGTADVYKVTVVLASLQQQAAAGLVELRLESGGGTVFERVFFDAADAQDFTLTLTVRLTSLSGSNTVKARLSTSAGNVDILAAATFPSFILVEAI